MTNDLISREALMQFPIRRDHYDRENGSEEFISGIETVLEYAESLPTVDAAPVVHSEWIKEEDRRNHWHCGNCGFVEGMAHYIMHYCPNCGARMDEEE